MSDELNQSLKEHELASLSIVFLSLLNLLNLFLFTRCYDDIRSFALFLLLFFFLMIWHDNIGRLGLLFDLCNLFFLRFLREFSFRLLLSLGWWLLLLFNKIDVSLWLLFRRDFLDLVLLLRLQLRHDVFLLGLIFNSRFRFHFGFIFLLLCESGRFSILLTSNECMKVILPFELLFIRLLSLKKELGRSLPFSWLQRQDRRRTDPIRHWSRSWRSHLLGRGTCNNKDQ